MLCHVLEFHNTHDLSVIKPFPHTPRFANYAQSGRSLTGLGASNTSIVPRGSRRVES